MQAVLHYDLKFSVSDGKDRRGQSCVHKFHTHGGYARVSVFRYIQKLEHIRQHRVSRIIPENTVYRKGGDGVIVSGYVVDVVLYDGHLAAGVPLGQGLGILTGQLLELKPLGVQAVQPPLSAHGGYALWR